MMEFTMYHSGKTGQQFNTHYRNAVVIRNAEDLRNVCRYDHVCVEFTNDFHRCNDDFSRCFAIAGDCDNDSKRVPDPANWLTPEKVAERLPGVQFYDCASRNNNKVKHPGEPSEEGPRPRYHYYFPLQEPITDINQAKAVMSKLLVLFPEFDDNGTKPAQFFYGHEEPKTTMHPGFLDIVTYFKNHPEIKVPEAPADEAPAEKPERVQVAGNDEYDYVRLNLADWLAVIPADDYGEWYTVGMAIKAAGEDVSLWDDFSKTRKKYPGYNEIIKKWNSFKGQGIGPGTLYYLAKKYDWQSDPNKYTGVYKAKYEAFKYQEELLQKFREAHRDEHAAQLAALGIDCAGNPYRYTWTLDFDGSIDEVTEIATGEIVYRKSEEERAAARTAGNLMRQDPDEETPPEWLITRQWQGREIKRVDEPKFAQMFQEEYKVHRINGVFFVDGESVQDDYILMLIQKKIAVYFKENTGRLTNNVFITLSNIVYTKQPEPDETKIYCKNGITILVKKDGTFETVNEDLFTLTRIGASYNPAADCPTFKKYLNDLFFTEDIPAVQEYFGYCLIPCTRAQAGLFVKGKGGEGKSVMRDVTMSLFGHSAIQEYIHQLGERFTIANLENKLVVVDDDLQSDMLKETSTMKKLITAREPFQVEKKQKTKYDAYLFSRIIAIGNTFIGSKFDHSDGFYRRQLLIDVKPKTRDEKDDDRFMSDKCIAEIDGILNWALEGLSRLINNNYHFSVSDRMTRTLDSIKHDGDNSLTFIEDDTYIEITHDTRDQVTTADLFTLYAVYCADNGDTPIKRKSFQLRTGERFKDNKIRIKSESGRLQGFSGIRLTDLAEYRLTRINDRERDRIARLP